MGAYGNFVHSFSVVDGRSVTDNPTTVRKPRGARGALEDGRGYTSIVQVRREGVRAFIDGKLVTELKTDYRNLTTDPMYSVKDAALLGIGSYRAVTAFHSIEILEITGRGRRMR